MTTGQKGFLVTIAGLLAIMVLDAVVFLTGHATNPGIQMLLMILPLLWLIAVFTYCILWDPMGRYPTSTPTERAGHILLFDREEQS